MQTRSFCFCFYRQVLHGARAKRSLSPLSPRITGGYRLPTYQRLYQQSSQQHAITLAPGQVDVWWLHPEQASPQLQALLHPASMKPSLGIIQHTTAGIRRQPAWQIYAASDSCRTKLCAGRLLKCSAKGAPAGEDFAAHSFSKVLCCQPAALCSVRSCAWQLCTAAAYRAVSVQASCRARAASPNATSFAQILL